MNINIKVIFKIASGKKFNFFKESEGIFLFTILYSIDLSPDYKGLYRRNESLMKIFMYEFISYVPDSHSLRNMDNLNILNYLWLAYQTSLTEVVCNEETSF